jgi:uncharacterized repeat protein (TIGR02543 family)
MKRKPTALILALLVWTGMVLLFFRTTPEPGASSAATGATATDPIPARETAAPLHAAPPDAEEARRLSPPSWTPPAVFAKTGAPTPQIPFPRGENSQRRHAAPETRDIPRELRTRVPAVLAMTPEDARLHLLPEEIDLHTRLARRMVLDTAALDHIIAGRASRLLAPTTGGEVLTLEFHAIKTRPPHTHTLLGRVVGEEETSDVLAVYHDGVIHASVARYAIEIDQHLEYRILTDGHMMVRELDPSTMTAVCGNGADTMADALSDPLPEEGFEIIPQDDGEVVEDTPGWRTIDVVVGYDQGARVADGGYSQIEARIIASVDRMSTSFANSLITNTELMLSGTIEDPNYVFPGNVAGSMSSNDELGGLNSFSDGYLDTVSNYYTLLGADLIAFITKQADGSAGIAFRPGRASVTARDYMTSTRITFVHELGHNLGCDHSWGDSNQAYHTHYGWRLEPPGATRVRTIMAYDWAWGSGHRIPYFGNPSVSFNGARTGAVNGYNVQGDSTADQRYFQGGLGYSGSDANRFGFNGANSALGANNANTINTGAGVSSYGATVASNRATRAAFNVTTPAAASLWERGQTMNVFFRGGDMKDLATIQLFKGGVLQSTLASNLNPATRRNFPWALPASLASGVDYMIRVTLNPGTAGAITADSGMFTVSGGAPYVVSHTPAVSPAVAAPVSQVALTFSQPMNPASFSIGSDILSFTGPQGLLLTPSITGASWSGGNTVLTIQFPPQSQPGFYRMIIGPEIAATDGKLLDQDLDDILGEPIDDRYIAGFSISGGGGGTVQTIWQDLVGTDAPDAGWSFSGTNSSWETGTPLSNPGTSHDGAPIIAQNLGGDYTVLENSYAQSPAIDCSGHTNITLSFRGWKGAGRNDTLYIDAWNGSSWQRVYSYTGPNGGASDSSWTLYQPSLGTHGNLNPDFKLRWGLVDVTTAQSGTQTGWQLDAIVLQGTTLAGNTAPWVTAHSPSGSLENPQGSIWIEFSNPMDTGSFSLGDIASFTGPAGSITASGFQWLNPFLLRVDFPGQFLVGSYDFVLAPTVLDENGQPLDQDFDGIAGETHEDAYLASFQIGSDAGPVDHFTFSGLPSDLSYGTTVDDIIIIARDTGGKIASTFTGSVTFGGTAGITGTTANFTNGILANVSITPPLAGNGLTLTVNNGAGQTGSATLNVAPALASIGFNPASLNQTYDGTARSVIVNINPPWVAYAVSYEGGSNAPVNAGGYQVSATVTDPNYQGSASDILIVAQASQTISFAPLGTMGNDVPSLELTATATSGLPVSYTSSEPSVASVSGNILTITGSGTTTLTASQPGNGNYQAAVPVARELTIVRVDPIAAPGGPYKLLFGQSLTLDGSASLASAGETLTSYEWDLNNDHAFGDVTGATPASISFTDLTTIWGMSQGLNAIQLKVTDTAGKTSTVSTTVEIVMDLAWDANGNATGQTDGGGAWLGANQWRSGVTNVGWAVGSGAVFGIGGTGGAVTLASPTIANAILFNSFSGTYTLGSPGQALTLRDGITLNSGARNVTFTSPIILGGGQSWLNNSSDNSIQLQFNGTVDNGGHDLTIGGSVATPPTRSTANVKLNAVLSGGGGLVKNGNGVLWLSGTTNHSYGGATTVNGGILRVQGSGNLSGLPGGNITLNGGVLESYWNDTFTRSLGSESNQIRITGGASGFSQHGSAILNVLLNGDATTPIQWGTPFFNPTTLILQEYTGDNSAQTVFQNRLDLNGADRTIQASGPGVGRSTISGIISNSTGTAGIIKTGSGQLILSANNTYNGTTAVNAGMVDFAGISLAGFGGGSGRNISVAEGVSVRRNTLDNAFLNRLVETDVEFTVMSATTANNLDFSSSTGANIPNAFLGNWTSNGAKMEYSGTLTPASDNYRLGGRGSSGLLAIVGTNKLTGTRGLIVGGTGATGIRVMLAGANDFSGDTVINAGAKLTLANNLALQHSTLNLGSAGGSFALNNTGTVTNASVSASPVFGGLMGSRNLLSVFTNTGGNNESNLSATAVTGFTLNPGDGKSISYEGAIGEFAPGTTLTKTGAGTQILNGVNTYSGATAIHAGKLLINGSTASGSVTVNAGATLGGTGTLGGNTTIGNNGRLEFDLSTSSSGHDKLALASGRTLAFSGASVLTITSSGGAEPGTYTLVTAPGGITGNAPATLNLPGGWFGTTTIVGNDLVLIVTSVGGPAPGSLAVTPADNLTSAGVVGGSFSPDSWVYTLANPGDTSMDWTASNLASWVDLSPLSGTLAAGASTTVTVSIGSGATSLAAGVYDDTVTFTNTTNGNGNTTRAVSLTIHAPVTYTVTFDPNGGDTPEPGSKQVTYDSDYGMLATVSRTGYTFNGWFTAPSGGTPVTSATTVTIASDHTLFAQWTQNGALAVTSGDFASSGNFGGPFTPPSMEYTLENTGGTAIEWTAGTSASWISPSATSGTLEPSATTTVTVSITATAGELVPGSYNDTITFTNTTNGLGNTTRGASLTVTAIPVEITLGDLNPTYDGTAKAVSVTTDPTPVAYTLTYDGEPDAPVDAGSYVVSVIVTEPNQSGSSSDTLVIAKAAQTIDFAGLDPAVEDAAPFALTATATSGLPVSFTSSNPAVATVSGNMVTLTGAGSTTITASQAGDGNHLPADDVTQTLTVISVYDNWASGVFANPFLVTDPNADPDGDGLVNLLEFAFGTDPTSGTTGPIAYEAGGNVTSPGTPIIKEFGGDYRAVFGRRKNHQSVGLSYTVEFSAGLNAWVASTEVPVAVTGADGAGEMEAVSVPFPALIPVAGGEAKPTFFRVAVSGD